MIVFDGRATFNAWLSALRVSKAGKKLLDSYLQKKIPSSKSVDYETNFKLFGKLGKLKLISRKSEDLVQSVPIKVPGRNELKKRSSSPNSPDFFTSIISGCKRNSCASQSTSSSNMITSSPFNSSKNSLQSLSMSSGSISHHPTRNRSSLTASSVPTSLSSKWSLGSNATPTSSKFMSLFDEVQVKNAAFLAFKAKKLVLY